MYLILEKLFKGDPKYFGSVLFLVDGDAKKALAQFIKKSNVLSLPGSKRPECLLFDYLSEDNCTFWTKELEKKGMTKQYFFTEHGPNSSKYSAYSKDRKKFSSWFYDQKETIEKYKMFEHWMKNHPDEVKSFKEAFVVKFNQLAKKNDLLLIESKK